MATGSYQHRKEQTPDSVGPLLILFILFQRQFVQSFMQAGIK